MNVSTSALLTDHYQLTMLQGYFVHRMNETAVFDFFVRRLPAHRNFLVAAGLEQVLEFLENLQFSADELAWLAGQPGFRRDFVDHLGQLRFTGGVHAMPEGTVFFANEPIIRITAPLPEAQLVETRIINLLQFQTMLASKAARSVLVAPGRMLLDFGLRRAHGAEAGLLAARAAYLAGFTGTSTMLAGKVFGIPTFGTMAHSFVQAHESELGAFEDFATANPENVVLLIDTYDTEAAAHKVVQSLAPRLQAKNIPIKAVRLDSGDLAEHARQVRRILDDGGLREVRIFASGNLEEQSVQKLIDAGAPIDGFGIGTCLDTCSDAPYLECAYKLQEYAGQPRRKYSEGKVTWPGRKQVYRVCDSHGKLAHDTMSLESAPADGEPLLQEMMRGGRRLAPLPALEEIRARAADQLARLPEPLRRLEPAAPHPVKISGALQQLADSLPFTRRTVG